MRKALFCLAVVLLAAAPARADRKAPRLVRDQWDAAYLEGARAGYYHTTVHEVERDGRKALRTTLAMHLTIRRYKETIRLRFETATVETPTGRVLALSSTHYLDHGKMVKPAAVE